MIYCSPETKNLNMRAAQVIALRVSEGLTAHTHTDGMRLGFNLCLKSAY